MEEGNIGKKGEPMKEIQLDKGRVALVDDEDFEVLNQYKWRVRSFNPDLFYAVRTRLEKEGFGKAGVSMHRQIMGLDKKEFRHIHVDHRDHNGLNNQKLNLRKCNLSQNNANRRSLPHTSKFLGVCYVIERNRWIASISKNNKSILIGRFHSEVEAALAYNKKAIEIHGEFANLNQV